MWNISKYQCECKKHHICEKHYIWNPTACSCKSGKYLAISIDDPVITCNEIINAETKTVPTNFNTKNATCKTKNVAFLLITITLLIAASIYSYLIKYKTEQKHLLPCYITNNKFKKFCINNIINMESKDEFKEIDIKNCTCYYLDDPMKVVDINFDNILLDEKSYKNSYENILIYDISYKTFMGEKRLRIRFDKVDGFIKIYNGSRYLV